MNLIDVSNVQGHIDWAKVKGVQGVWLKATEGLTFDDSFYKENRKGAQAAGLRVGAYHFARPENNTAIAEADHFSNVIGKPGRKDLKPVLDMEGHGDESWAHTFSKRVYHNTGCYPLFYSYLDWIQTHKFKIPVGNGLWLADYSGLLHPPVAPKPWKKYVAWQYSDKGKVDGITGFVDRSVGSKLGVLAHPVLGLL